MPGNATSLFRDGDGTGRVDSPVPAAPPVPVPPWARAGALVGGRAVSVPSVR
ncbi:hypothetical protein GCM10010360_18970 [Streptomyces nogalater]